MLGTAFLRRFLPSSMLSEEEEAPPPRPSARRPPADRMQDIMDYTQLCKKVGAKPRELRSLTLRQFLADNGMPEYDPRQVADWLNHLAQEAGPHVLYHWKPLREKDLKMPDIRWWWHNDNYGERAKTSSKQYDGLVPSTVLLTVQKIAKAFPDACFFVSEVEDPDPFLAVGFPNQLLVIVDWWAEQGFKLSPVQ